MCGDSHTSTHGAFGALAFGIGTSEVSHVLATQSLLQNTSKTLAVTVEGKLRPGVTAKDLVLAVIARLGIGGGTGHVIEYRGSAIRALSMEERMTVCNMSIEAGARAGHDRPRRHDVRLPEGPAARAAGRRLGQGGRRLAGAAVRRRRRVRPRGEARRADARADDHLRHQPGHGHPDQQRRPRRRRTRRRRRRWPTWACRRSKPLLGHKVDVVFIGSCTNSRMSDLRAAAGVLKGRKVADGVRVLVVPGSQQIKDAAEAEGLDQRVPRRGRRVARGRLLDVHRDERRPAVAGQYAVSTSNRNFEGRQGAGGRTFLASPLTAAAAAVTGKITDARELT